MYDYFLTVESKAVAVFHYESGEIYKRINHPTHLLNLLRGGKTFTCSSSIDFPEEYTDSYDVLSVVDSVRKIASGEYNFEVL